KATEQREERAPNQHVMEMRDNEKRVMDLQIEGHGTQQHAGESAQYEDGDEAEDKMQGSVQSQTAAPERGDPAEDLHSAGDGDHHACGGEITGCNLRQAGGEHMMHPQPEPNETRRDQR